MFFYEIPGLRITISAQRGLSLYFPQTIQRDSAIEGLSTQDQQTLYNSAENNNLELVRSTRGSIPTWLRPPKDTARYQKICRAKFLGLIPYSGDNGKIFANHPVKHYHYLATGNNPINRIFLFLSELAALTEKGAYLYLSEKDLANLTWHYKKYFASNSLERLSDAVSTLAINILTSGDEPSEEKLISLKKLRKQIEMQIGKKNPGISAIQSEITNVRETSFSENSDNDFEAISTRGNNINLAPKENSQFPFFAKQRTDFRITNKNVVQSLLLLAFLTYQASKFLGEDEENLLSLSKVCLTLLTVLPWYLLTEAFSLVIASSYQEPRHTLRAIDNIFSGNSEQAPPRLNFSGLGA